MQQIAHKATLTIRQLVSVITTFRLGQQQNITQLRSGVINANYLVTTKRGKFVVRSYTFKTRGEVKSECHILAALHRRGFPCPKPVGPVVMIGGHPVCCFQYINGRQMRRVTPGSLGQIARLLARMHLLTEGMYVPHRREGEGVAVIRRYVSRKKHLILQSRFKGGAAFIRFLERELAGVAIPSGLPRGVIHADVKTENIIIGNGGKLSLIDFDNAYVDSFVMDIGSTISWLCLTGERVDIRKVEEFLRAYDLVRRIPDRERRYIMECVRFTFLKHAFKYAYICLPRLRFAEQRAYHFILVYKSLFME